MYPKGILYEYQMKGKCDLGHLWMSCREQF